MEQSAREIFGALSRELRQLAEQTCHLQDQLSPRGYEGVEIEAFQSLDAIHQTLDCLAIYAAEIGVVTSTQCKVSVGRAIDRLCLAALAARLRGDVALQIRSAKPEVELF